MKSPIIAKNSILSLRKGERGVTMILVALAMIAIIAMAALSIDVTTLYLAREEAQRSADTAALGAARIISVSGITGTADPSTDNADWQAICGGAGSTASLAARAIAQQNSVGGSAPTISVLYGPGGTNADCSGLSQAFAVNPIVTVRITRTGLPTLFSRVWGRGGNSVSASATAEAFNPSNSGNIGYGPAGTITPVQPRCVKPIVVPNLDPLNPAGATCTTNCAKFVNPASGAIQHPGISLGGAGSNGTIGETFWLVADCRPSIPGSCVLRQGGLLQPQANLATGSRIQSPPNLLYAPGQIGTTVTAIPSCTQGDAYEEAIEGCDSPTNYQCGVANANAVDLGRNPEVNATSNGVSCLIHEGDPTVSQPDGQDRLNPYAAPSAYPFEIVAGTSNPVSALANKSITSSSSIVSLPIYDNSVNIASGATTNVTFVGFLQVFINAVDQFGNVNVTVLNVSGCGNGTGTTGPPVAGSSPVPVRLITPP